MIPVSGSPISNPATTEHHQNQNHFWKNHKILVISTSGLLVAGLALTGIGIATLASAILASKAGLICTIAGSIFTAYSLLIFYVAHRTAQLRAAAELASRPAPEIVKPPEPAKPIQPALQPTPPPPVVSKPVLIRAEGPAIQITLPPVILPRLTPAIAEKTSQKSWWTPLFTISCLAGTALAGLAVYLFAHPTSIPSPDAICPNLPPSPFHCGLDVPTIALQTAMEKECEHPQKTDQPAAAPVQDAYLTVNLPPFDTNYTDRILIQTEADRVDDIWLQSRLQKAKNPAIPETPSETVPSAEKRSVIDMTKPLRADQCPLKGEAPPTCPPDTTPWDKASKLSEESPHTMPNAPSASSLWTAAALIGGFMLLFIKSITGVRPDADDDDIAPVDDRPMPRLMPGDDVDDEKKVAPNDILVSPIHFPHVTHCLAALHGHAPMDLRGRLQAMFLNDREMAVLTRFYYQGWGRDLSAMQVPVRIFLDGKNPKLSVQGIRTDLVLEDRTRHKQIFHLDDHEAEIPPSLADLTHYLKALDQTKLRSRLYDIQSSYPGLYRLLSILGWPDHLDRIVEIPSAELACRLYCSLGTDDPDLLQTTSDRLIDCFNLATGAIKPGCDDAVTDILAELALKRGSIVRQLVEVRLMLQHLIDEPIPTSARIASDRTARLAFLSTLLQALTGLYNEVLDY
jgi:hypothetical protein